MNIDIGEGIPPIDINSEWLKYEVDIRRCNQSEPKITSLGRLQARIEALTAQGIPPHEHNTRKEVHSDAECLGATRLQHSAKEFRVLNLCHATRLTGVLCIPRTPNQSHAF